MSKKTDNRAQTRVVIIGGGGAGSSVARSLSASLDPSKYNLVVVNSRPFRIFNIATARMVVSEKDHIEDSALIPYDKLFYGGNGTFVHGIVTAIRAGNKGGDVVLEDGTLVPYDILVLTPGSRWPGPLAFPDDPQQVSTFVKDTRSKFQSSTHVTIAGGGAVGLELAGEIKDIWPTKKVTIVHAGRLLLNSAYPDSFRSDLESAFRARGVDVINNDFLDDIPDGMTATGVTTRNGRRLDADMVVSARGPRPNTGFISTLGPDALTKDGFVRVQPTLQLKGHPNIFAGGDAIDWEEQKQEGKAGKHASVIAANVLAYVEGKPLQEYKGSIEMIAVTNGRNGGQGYIDVLWGIRLGNWLTRMLKSKTLIIPMARAKMGF